MRKLHIMGINADVDTGAAEDVWAPGASYAFPAAAATTTVVSSSANDTAAGSGARTVRVEGLDSNLQEIYEDATLNGVAAVTLTKQFYRINMVTVLTAGSGLVNAGTVDVKHSTTVLSRIAVGENRARQAIFTPSHEAHGWRVTKVYLNALNAVAGTVHVKLWTKKASGLWQVRHSQAVYGTTSPSTAIDLASPIGVDVGEDIRLEATTTTDNTSISAGFDIEGA